MKTLREQTLAKCSRKALLEKTPQLEEVFATREQHYGRLVCGGTTGGLTRDREVMLYQYESTYELVFINPENPQGEQDRSLFLSREAIAAAFSLYELLGDCERDGEELLKNLRPQTEAAQ